MGAEGDSSDAIRSFEDLRAWQACRRVRVFTAEFVRSLPREERRRLADQMLRAARSVTANIAEGYGRFHYQENAQFCRQARGSLYELVDHFICAMDEGLASGEELGELRSLAESAARLLNGYIRYLQAAKRNSGRAREDEAIYKTEDPAHPAQ